MKKVLLIDDEVDHIAMLQTRVEASGYQCLSAYDGEEGLKVALDEIPDIIILDIVMPKMNGYEMCYALKNNDKMKNIPIIIITASTLLISKFLGIVNKNFVPFPASDSIQTFPL